MHKTVLLVVVIASLPVSAAATEPPLTLEAIFGTDPIVAPKPTALGWRPGHGAVVWLESEERLVQMVAATGERSTVIDRGRIARSVNVADETDVALGSAVFSPRGDRLLVTVGDELWLVTIASGDASRLDSGDGAEKEPSFAPDGTRVAWVRDHDLYVAGLDPAVIHRLTDDGSDTVHNGVFDWVYWEELAGRSRRSYAWFPDGDGIAWIRLDDGPVPPYHLVDMRETRTSLRTQLVPRPGDPLPTASVHAVRWTADGPPGQRLDFTPVEPDVYLPRVGPLPDGSGIWFQQLDRPQQRLTLRTLRFGDTIPLTRVDETDPFWVEPVDQLRFLTDGSLLWLSRRSGWARLERIAADGRRSALTPDGVDVMKVIGSDRAGTVAWAQLARPTPRDRQLVRVDVASGAVTTVSHGPGTWSGTLSPDAEWLLVEASTATRPPRDVVMPSTGGIGRDLRLRDHSRVDDLELVAPRFITIQAADGTALDAMIKVPPDTPDDARLPAVVYTYGGPHAAVVADAWSSRSLLDEWFVRRGMVVFALDNRGASARGRAFETATDRRLGSSQLPDQLAGVQWLASHASVDPERIGLWGWSYGGYMTAYALTHAPGTFAVGVAVAPVTDWRLYDAVYTERYMDTPDDNPDGYRDGSVIAAIDRLSDPLLIIHGTADDNVHLQHTIQLADRAWRQGRPFDLALVPGGNHGLKIDGTRLQVYRRLTSHLLSHLQPPAVYADP